MNVFIRILLVVFTLGVAQARDDDLQTLFNKIQNEASGKGWEIAQDIDSITLIHKNVQFLNPINPPPIDEKTLWKEYSFTNDYRITILFDSKLSQKEYDQISELRNKLIAERTKRTRFNRRPLWGLSEPVNEESLLLPDYFFENYSVYIYSTAPTFEIRPNEIVTVRDKIVNLLDKNCSKYATNAITSNP